MCSDCAGPIDGDQNVNTEERLDNLLMVKREKWCARCKQTREQEDSFCWLCGVELSDEPANACTKDESHKVDSPDHYCAKCGAQTIYGIKKDGSKTPAMQDKEAQSGGFEGF